MDTKALFKISYGLYVLTAQENGFDNGCIINTFGQITDNPKRVSVTVNKSNKTCDMIKNTGTFNVSIISEAATFEIFSLFGFQSGNSIDKFKGYTKAKRSKNGLFYIEEGINAYVSARVYDSVDVGTHIIFIADVTDAEVLDDKESATYSYYHKNIKPKPAEGKKTGYRCKICGYVYEGEVLPENFICPICKHGTDDFEKI